MLSHSFDRAAERLCLTRHRLLQTIVDNVKTSLHYRAGSTGSLKSTQKRIHLGACIPFSVSDIFYYCGCTGIDTIGHKVGNACESESVFKQAKKLLNTVSSLAAGLMMDRRVVERAVKKDVCRIVQKAKVINKCDYTLVGIRLTSE